MRKPIKEKTTSIILICFLIFSCTHIKDNESNVSRHGEKRSHNNGKNCFSCHAQGGDGEGWFNLAGSVWNSSGSAGVADVNVMLYSGPNGEGELKYMIEGDVKGNFFTTEKIDFSSGLYPAVQHGNKTLYMSSPIQNGSCNTCHGAGTKKISF